MKVPLIHETQVCLDYSISLLYPPLLTILCNISVIYEYLIVTGRISHAKNGQYHHYDYFQ
jgi:hypothetical protein